MLGKKYLFHSVILFLILSISACSKEDKAGEIRNAIEGTWKLKSVTINGSNADISSYPDLIQFQSNTIFQEYSTSTNIKNRGGWNYEGDMLNISLYLPVAFYIMGIDSNNLTLKSYDFNPDGSLSTTVQQYQRTNDSDII